MSVGEYSEYKGGILSTPRDIHTNSVLLSTTFPTSVMVLMIYFPLLYDSTKDKSPPVTK